MLAITSLMSIALVASSVVSAVSIPARHRVHRDGVPATYNQTELEPYEQYHARYLAEDCQAQHNTSFFAQCCNPLQIWQNPSDLPALCNSSTPSSSVAPSSSPSPTPTNAGPAAAVASPAPAASSSGISPLSVVEHVMGGYATYFYQNGVAGACGTVHSDTDMICAIDQDRYGNSGVASPLCDQLITITNLANGNVVNVTVADDCPTCNNGNSIDLSVGAFEALDALSVGLLDITWSLIN